MIWVQSMQEAGQRGAHASAISAGHTLASIAGVPRGKQPAGNRRRQIPLRQPRAAPWCAGRARSGPSSGADRGGSCNSEQCTGSSANQALGSSACMHVQQHLWPVCAGCLASALPAQQGCPRPPQASQALTGSSSGAPGHRAAWCPARRRSPAGSKQAEGIKLVSASCGHGTSWHAALHCLECAQMRNAS